MAHFIHTADWQIGTQFGAFDDEQATLLAEARFETISNIARLATKRNVDAVVVAGDVFDYHTVTSVLIRRLFSVLEGFSGRWILLPGNHDAALIESVWTRAKQLDCIGRNVTVASVRRPIELPEHGLVILPAPLTQRQTYDDLTEYFDHEETREGLIRIGLAHGSVASLLPEGVDATNPIAETRANTARLDYLALGDWHGVLKVNDRTWYSGTPEQDRFKSNRPGYVLDVTIGAPGELPQVEEVRLGRYTWQVWDEVINVSTDVDALVVRLAQLNSNDVLRIDIRGSTELESSDALERALEITRARIRVLRADTSLLQLQPTDNELTALGGRGGYLANVVAHLKDLQSDTSQGSIATEALRQLARIQRTARTMP
jgi:DNA repair exonuclease SbcCD nuclease subunit